MATENHIKLERKLGILSESKVPDTVVPESEPSQVKVITADDDVPHTLKCENSSLHSLKESSYFSGSTYSRQNQEFFQNNFFSSDKCLYISNQDAFSSVSTLDMPFTLNSHWSPPIYNPFTSLSYSQTFRSHYVRIPSPGDYFVTADKVSKN